MALSDKNNESDRPLTEWLTGNRSSISNPVEPSEYEQQNSNQILQKSSDVSYSALVASSIKLENEEEVAGISLKRKRKTVNKDAKTKPAEAKFSALVASSANKEKKRDKSLEKQHSPHKYDPKRFTTRCFELGQSIARMQVKGYKESVSPEKVRTTVELGFGVDMLIYLVFESNGSRNLYEADLVEYFVNNEESIAEIAPSLKKLFKEQMYQSLINGIATFSVLKEQRRELLERLRIKYNPLLNVETTGKGFCSVEARDLHQTYFQAQWKVIYRRALDVFDNAFMFSGDYKDTTSLVGTFNEFSRLTNGEEMGMEELEQSWEKIMTEVKELSEQHT